MANKTFNWEIEETFFGAILGAFLGTFIGGLPVHYITLMILFFVVFPMTLRKADQISRYAMLLATAANLLWMILLVYDLNAQSHLELENGLVFVVIFIGWLLSISARIWYHSK